MISQLGGGIQRMAGVRDAHTDVLYLVVIAAPAIPAAERQHEASPDPQEQLYGIRTAKVRGPYGL
ncbi:hypothetical protein ACFT8V_30100 [Streptomyces griseoincarnatus]|uniref:hypothetical protein n=1 Tax=Streptomyces sp. I4(2020) TaxID=2760981 RepID=UPI0018EE6CE5|nr:hypothetical protein [Streptomyces sp. I4(2020)]MBJ6613967.1 hypothetical protein [Streptomyces sp. I3(2020)]MBJ6630191.1 hypothetical protein [Streptomyces sp. I4(2020)]